MLHILATTATAIPNSTEVRGVRVVATCKEDLSWIDREASNYNNVIVYDKCDMNRTFSSANVTVHTMENIGSCDHAFLQYIVANYESLPDAVHFTKGVTHFTEGYNDNPSQSPHPDVRCRPWCSKYEKYKHLGRKPEIFGFSLDDYKFTNNPSNSNEFIFQKSPFANMKGWIEATNGLDVSMYLDTRCTRPMQGMFSATRAQILNTPKSTYRMLLNQQTHANEEIDHFIERSWGAMFCSEHASTATSNHTVNN
ncbi:hypothetical protein TrVE_jg7078 [Triparma verrucosa]|uniref:Uncharacterized protein n=1 Tax=Triparma verrucosa TaxID=1606542 RepID=A0A9W7FDF7_9STRA|nr:hypothetical protein TrVE_jg7078 [Triparma verrucosa]